MTTVPATLRGAAGAEQSPEVVVLHGPDRRPLHQAGPFHGIVSRGLMGELGPDSAVDWPRWAPWLDAALAAMPAAVAAVPPDVVDAARGCGWTTFSTSANAAAAFAAAELGGLLDQLSAGFSAQRAAAIELWQIKEGHTSSVWRLTVTPDDCGTSVRAALNVARDDAAGHELLESANELERLRSASTVAVARVIGQRPSTDDSPAILAQEWIEGALELAFLRRRTHGHVRLHAVERFVTDEDAPARVVGAVGRQLDDAEHEQVACDATRLLVDGATAGPSKATVSLARFDVDHGDWVWADDGPALVALATGRDIVRRDELLEHLRDLWPARHGIADDEGKRAIQRGATAAFHAAGQHLELSRGMHV